jgi:putative DNA-binding protein
MEHSEKRISRSILLGRRIRTYRERAGLTIAQLAALADVAPTTLAELERGKGNPRYETLCNLAAGLGIPITVLVQYEDMMLLDIY